VPYTYSAEAFPLYIRELGMSYATSVTWLFNWMLAMSLPAMQKKFGRQGAFAFYAFWIIVGWFAVFLFLPETKGKTLEELDYIFDVSHKEHMKYDIALFKYYVNKLRGERPETVPPLWASAQDEPRLHPLPQEMHSSFINNQI
jgi:hypothetical protein